jgi:hypothetical protein
MESARFWEKWRWGCPAAAIGSDRWLTSPPAVQRHAASAKTSPPSLRCFNARRHFSSTCQSTQRMQVCAVASLESLRLICHEAPAPKERV